MQLESRIPRQVLIVVAHPDDIEFGSGGSVAVWTDAGAQVTYCIITNGAAGSNDPSMTPERLIEIRRAEQLEAARADGVRDVRFLGYPDGELVATIDLRRQLTRLIRELRPDRVVIMDPTAVLISEDDFHYINHPDHRAAGEAALYAVFPSAETRLVFPDLIAEGYEPHHVEEVYFMLSDKGNVAVDVSGVMERKIAALLAHKSQLDERVGEMVRGWDSRAGEQVGVQYAETYRAMRFPREAPPTPAETEQALEAAGVV